MKRSRAVSPMMNRGDQLSRLRRVISVMENEAKELRKERDHWHNVAIQKALIITEVRVTAEAAGQDYPVTKAIEDIQVLVKEPKNDTESSAPKV